MKKTPLLLLAAIILYWLFSGRAEPLPVAAPDSERKTSTGTVIGYADTDNTHAWLGIPYAASTAGEGRWRKPQPAPAWSETRQALQQSDPCPQPFSIFADVEGREGEVAGSEDCLALNIWAPRFTSENMPSGDNALPIMLWIHGGGNTVGSAAGYPGALLAGRENVIVVAINYRLGLLGWFSHRALHASAHDLQDASGNFGTLDTIAALQWVKDNIAGFGGNPNNVTIFGESAGGRNVYMLLASPLAKGLFHRAIVQSGSTASMPLSLAENYSDDEKPGLEHSSSEIILRLLQNADLASDRDSAKTYAANASNADLEALLRSQTLDQLYSNVAGDSGSYSAPQTFRDGHVLPKQTLLELFADPTQYNAVPIITGSNRDEQKLFMALDPEFANLWFGIVPRIKDQPTFDNLAAYHSDRWKLAAVDTPAEIISANSSEPVFAYRFDWDEGGSLGLVDWSTALGAAHGFEIPFVFGNFDSFAPIPRLFIDDKKTGRDALSKSMMRYWAEFARSGNPKNGSKGEEPAWLPWQAGEGGMLVLDTESDGGLRMTKARLKIADFRRRLEFDNLISEQQERCDLFLELFNSPRKGVELFDAAEFARLKCGAPPQ